MRRARLALVVVVMLAPALQAFKAQPPGSLAFAHIQAAHPVHRALLREGYDRSVTFRQLVGEIEASDWLVFLQAGRCPERATVACLLHFVGTFEGRSYVRVVVRHEHRHADNVIASLAHELQHAREVIEAPGVHDAAGIRDLFTRIGRVSVESAGVRTYETDRARQIGEAVWRELMKKR